MSNDCDVIIVGGGMVGAALAALLAARSFSVVVVERAPPPVFAPDDEVDLRVSAVAPGSRRVLAAAGAWDSIPAARASAYRGMHVWDAGADGPDAGIRFDAADIGEPDLGAIVENRVILHALVERLQTQPAVRWLAPAVPASLRQLDTAAELRLKDGRRLRALLVVGADGARSSMRQWAGIETRGRDYEQNAVVTHVRSELPHREIARQRFLPDGPMALLPLADGRSSVVWSTTPAHAEAALALDADAFSDALTQASGEALGRLEVAAGRAAFPLRMQVAMRYSAQRLVLVGDAAHSVHPLAGLGVNLGFADAAALAEVLEASRSAGEDIGDAPALRRYERWRKGENLLAMAMLDGLQRLFASDSPFIAGMRVAGLGLVDRQSHLKNRFARRAMGLEGDLPRLMLAR